MVRPALGGGERVLQRQHRPSRLGVLSLSFGRSRINFDAKQMQFRIGGLHPPLAQLGPCTYILRVRPNITVSDAGLGHSLVLCSVLLSPSISAERRKTCSETKPFS